MLSAAAAGGAVMVVYPNPDNAARTIVVWTGRVLSGPLEPALAAGWMMPLNLLPDFLTAKDGKVTSAGYFNQD